MNKQIEQKEKYVRLTEKQAIKLQEENMELKRRCVKEEEGRGKLLDVIKGKNEKIAGLHEKIHSLGEDLTSLEGEFRWAQDKVSQKELQNRKIKEKLKQIEKENEELGRTIEFFRNTKSSFKQEKEEKIELKKPFLFGPEDSLIGPE